MEYQPLDVQPFDPVNHAAAAAERRKRLMGVQPVKTVPIAPPKPEPRIEYVHRFDEHVLAWREHLGRERMANKDYLRARCRDLGIKYGDMIGTSRLRKHCEPRQMLMWEVKQRSPEISLPQIGRLFGGRDHTTILHGIRAHEQRRASE